MVGAFFIAMINLVNLAPAPPLDGSKALGPVLARIHPMVEKAAMILVGGLAVWWGVSTGRYILAVFLAIAVLGQLRRGAWRPGEAKLTWPEAARVAGPVPDHRGAPVRRRRHRRPVAAGRRLARRAPSTSPPASSGSADEPHPS